MTSGDWAAGSGARRTTLLSACVPLASLVSMFTVYACVDLSVAGPLVGVTTTGGEPPLFGFVTLGVVFAGVVFAGVVFAGVVFAGVVFAGVVVAGVVVAGVVFTGVVFAG